jgi:hypothetical protein
MPTKKKTSDLESTLPSWLRDIRQASGDENSLPEEKPAEMPKPFEPVAPPPAKPAPPKPKEAASPLDFLAGLAQANDEEEDAPDWLKSLQTGVPAEPAKTPEPSAEQPADWLSGLQSEGQQNEPPAASEPDWGFGDQPATFNFDASAESASQISGDTPDWLNALQAQADESAQPVQPASPSSAQPTEWQTPNADTPDWLSALSDSGISAAPVQPEPEPAKQQPVQPDDNLGWLAELSDSGVGTTPVQPESKPVEQTPVQADDTPDWLASLSGTEPVEPQPAQGDDTPDWLASLGGSESSPVEQPSVWSAPDVNAPDWLSSLGESSAAPAEPPSSVSAPGDDTPDWLASLGGDSTVASEPFSAASAPDTDTPDWLSSLGGDINAAETPAPGVTAQQPEGEMSDWLSSLGSEPVTPEKPAPIEPLSAAPVSDADLPPWLAGLTSDAKPAEPAVAPQPVDSDVPDWMAGLQGSSSAESPALPEMGASETPAADIPDWMAGLSAEAPQTSQANIPDSTPPVDSDLPSWLSNALGEKPAQPASESKPFNTGALRELGPMDETPDWMAKIGGPSPTPIEIPEETPSQEPEIFSEQESAFPVSADSPTSPPAPGDEQNLDSIFSMDMPDWLSGFTPTETEVSEAKGAERPTEDNISPADLPSWVQAMRPVEDVMGGKVAQDEDEESPIERQGPLAGLRSVLPGMSSAPTAHKSKTYSIRLQVADTQQAQAALLEEILNSESTPQAVVKRPEAIVIRPLRWIIAGILLITVLFGALLPDITGGSVFPSPDKSGEQSHIGAFKEIIDNLPDNANVLVVADYQPGFAGEIEPAAGPVLDQLMAKNARLAFISTAPIGSYMAERLLQKFSTKYPYQAGTQYANLGYLPGGAGGIQVFAELPLTTVGRDLWAEDALKAVTKFSNFATVIVMTDNPDTGRLWIEQAEPSLRPQPMLMVISAQAEPLIRPYLASGQIKGMVSGLEDGVLYESLISAPGQARSYWDPFGVAVLASELLIIVGGVWGLIAGIRARRAKKMEQDEA